MDAKYKVLIYATACDMLLSYKKEIPAYLASIFALTPTSSSFKINFSPILDAMLIYFQTEKKRIEADLKIISTGLELAASVRDYIDTTKTKLSYEVEE